MRITGIVVNRKTWPIKYRLIDYVLKYTAFGVIKAYSDKPVFKIVNCKEQSYEITIDC